MPPPKTIKELYDLTFIKAVSENPDINTEDTYNNKEVLQKIKHAALITGSDYLTIYRNEYSENLERMSIIVGLKQLIRDNTLKDVVTHHLWSYLLYLRIEDANNEIIQGVTDFIVDLNNTDNYGEAIQTLLDIALKHRGVPNPDLYRVIKDLSVQARH